MIAISFDFINAENDYITSNSSYSTIASKYNIPLNILSKYAKKNNWVDKRKNFNSLPRSYQTDISKLARSSDTLESIIESAFSDLSHSSTPHKDIDTKTLKDLTSALKEAINIKQNILLLPIITEQKQLDFQLRKNPPMISSENEIKVILDDDTDKYCM